MHRLVIRHFESSRLADCRYTCHTDCCKDAVLPCVPRKVEPNVLVAVGEKYRLVELVPPTRPFIPHVIIHCILELERRGLATEGLYRVSA